MMTVNSSVVPTVKVGDPIVQSMVDEVSSVLRSVDERYFPYIEFVAYEQRDDKVVLYYAAKGKGFKVGVVCGTDGSIQKAMFVSNSGKSRSQASIVSSPENLREWIDYVGSKFYRG